MLADGRAMTTYEPDTNEAPHGHVSEDEEMSSEQRAAMDQALALRREGGTRTASIEVLTTAGFTVGAADVMIDGFDELCSMLHGVRPADVSPELAAKLDEAEANRPPEERRVVRTKSADELVKAARAMAAANKSRADVTTFLTSEGVSADEAQRVAAKISMDVSAARARFDKSKSKAENNAYLKIGLGVLLVIVGFILMSSGAESGRRSPLGVVIGGGFLVASGVKELTSVQNQSFEQRAREVMR